MYKYIDILCIIFITNIVTLSATYNILILGGNGMLGSTTVQSLLAVTNVDYKITILNRGNWYWDTEKTIKPFVTHYQCTRGDGFREDCAQISNDIFFDTIVDFSCYNPLDIEDVLIVLGLSRRFKRYIYISSDSVYEVCKPKGHDGYSREEDAVRPEDETSKEENNKKDGYGHRKLQGEEVLQEYHERLNFEYIALRLPDVIGPRDNTLRFYKYFMWTKLHKIIGPLHIPKQFQDVPLSFVYSVDVGSLIASLVNPDVDVNVFNQSYNLAFKETITLKDFLNLIGDWLKHGGNTTFDESETAYLNYGFPSVSRGPVDISKAVGMLKWSPTALRTAVDIICDFYHRAQYDTEFKNILDSVLNALDVRRDKYRAFLELHFNNSNSKTEL